MRRLINHFLNNTVNFEGSTLPLAIFRVGLVCLIWTKWAAYFSLYRYDYRGGTLQEMLVGVIFFVGTVLLFIGFFTRLAAILTAIALGLTYYYLGFMSGVEPYTHHHCYILFIFSLILTLTPCGNSLSIDSLIKYKRYRKQSRNTANLNNGPLWATRLICFQVSMIYLWGGYTKLNSTFLSGENLERIFMYFYFGSDFPSWFFAKPLIALLSWSVVLLEFFLVFALWFSKTRLLATFLGCLLHLSFYYLLPVSTFSLTMCLSYILFFNPDRFDSLIFRSHFPESIKSYRESSPASDMNHPKHKPKNILFIYILVTFIVVLLASLTIVFLKQSRISQANAVQSEVQKTSSIKPIKQSNSSSPILFDQDNFAMTEKEEDFLNFVRELVLSSSYSPQARKELKKLFRQTSFPQRAHGVALTFYNMKTKYSRVVRVSDSSERALSACLQRIQDASYLPKHINSAEAYIQIDFILNKPVRVDWGALELNSSRTNHFEIGVDGIRAAHNKQIHYFLPGDAFVKSVLSKKNLKQRISSLFPGVKFKDIQLYRFRSQSFVNNGSDWIELVRGYPKTETILAQNMQDIALAGIENLMRYQNPNGSFNYYYDAYRDSDRDHNARKGSTMEQQYNMVRHFTGTMALMHYYELYPDEKVLESAKRSLDFMLTKMASYQASDGQTASHIVHNGMSKLGAVSLALEATLLYKTASNSNDFDNEIRQMKRHIVNQVLPSGEFRYFYVKENDTSGDLLNYKNFNFYYPGEALLALTTYYSTVATQIEKEELKVIFNQTIDFLLMERPKIYKDRYKTLPSDAWLMMVFDLLVRNDILRRQDMIDFTFSEANTMINHQYNESNAPYPDYIGAFYYFPGDFPYTDGARSEGLVGALKLAIHLENEPMIQRITGALLKSALAVSRLSNTPESLYHAKNPQKALGGIRFKYTRQWIRIDSIQHVVSFYLKFLPVLESLDTSKFNNLEFYRRQK